MPAPMASGGPESPDVVLVGGGIMSANLAVLLRLLDPRLAIHVLEAAPVLATEASDASNNAGTGHAGICELSYTPSRDANGKVPVGRALRIFAQFERSLQFYAHAAATGMVGDPAGFIRPVPHVCLVHGPEDVAFLAARHEALRAHHFFGEMRMTSDPGAIHAWAPLVMEGRKPGPVAASTGEGTEVDFGELARRLLGWLAAQEGCTVSTGWKVDGLSRAPEGWRVSARQSATDTRRILRARFVFVGAGGGTLPILQTAGLPEVRGLAGFPIGGQWLVCDEPSVAARHAAKVYGATPPSSPSLGAPHLDLRMLGGPRRLMFGPFASWTTRFLRNSGAMTDLPASIRPGNLATLLRTALRNRALVRYLVAEGLQDMGARLVALRDFYPAAIDRHWRVVDAGIRVQTLRKEDGGAVSFGTEVLASADRSVAALMGASPGASVSVGIALDVIATCFPRLLSDAGALSRARAIFPAFEKDLAVPANAALFQRVARATRETLGLAPVDGIA